MEIFLLIVRIIGILLAVCIFLLGAVIAVPVRYRISAQVQQKNVEGSAVFHWFFHIIDCRIFYGEEGLIYKLRIFGIRVGAEKKKKRKPKKSRNKKKKKPSDEANSKESEPSGEQKSDFLQQATETPDRCGDEDAQDVQKGNRDSDEDAQDVQKGNRDSNEKSEDGKKGNNRSQNGKNKKKRRKRKRTKKESIFHRIHRFETNLKQRISNLFAEGGTVKEKILNIKNIISDEMNKIVFVKIWKELRFLLRHFSPRKAKGELAFGMADPAQTGQVLGALSVLPFWARYRINVCPDFEAERFFVEGQLWMKGHIRICHFLLSVIRLIKDKNVRRLLKKIRT